MYSSLIFSELIITKSEVTKKTPPKKTRPQKTPMSINLYTKQPFKKKKNDNSIISPSSGLEYDVLRLGHHVLWLDIWLGHNYVLWLDTLLMIAIEHRILCSGPSPSNQDELGTKSIKSRETINIYVHTITQPYLPKSQWINRDLHAKQPVTHTAIRLPLFRSQNINLTCHATVSLQDQDSLDSIKSTLTMFLSLSFSFFLNTIDLLCFSLLYSHLPPTQAPVHYLFN